MRGYFLSEGYLYIIMKYAGYELNISLSGFRFDTQGAGGPKIEAESLIPHALAKPAQFLN